MAAERGCVQEFEAIQRTTELIRANSPPLWEKLLAQLCSCCRADSNLTQQEKDEWVERWIIPYASVHKFMLVHYCFIIVVIETMLQILINAHFVYELVSLGAPIQCTDACL